MMKHINKIQCKIFNKIQNFSKDESGMAFLEAIILLGVVVLLVGVFIGFKDQIVSMVQEIIDRLKLE